MKQPDLPIEHPAVKRRVTLDNYAVDAHRAPERDTSKPDTIYITFCNHGGTVTIYITPSALVHMANELLTDNERAAILAPSIAGAGTE